MAENAKNMDFLRLFPGRDYQDLESCIWRMQNG